MATDIVLVEDLTVSYKNVRAVNHVSFSVEQGEILAIIGPNGSGKTSTVECIEGLRKPDHGSIQVFGKSPREERSEIYKLMGVQLQETEYPSKIRVDEQCKLFASFYDRPADWNLLLSQMNLADKRKRQIHKLSGGEKQRLSILLSLMGRPKLLIMDEITTGLDPEVRQNMWQSFDAIRKTGVTIILVSHYLDEVEALADKILYMEKGNQRFWGTQNQFREYVKGCIPQEEWDDGCSLEKLYLKLVPKTQGISMEWIL